MAQNSKSSIINLGVKKVKDMPVEPSQIPADKVISNRETIVTILARAADDFGFLSQLAENPGQALRDYDLNQEERATLASGDLQRIESWVGKLDKRLSTWPLCRLNQEKW